MMRRFLSLPCLAIFALVFVAMLSSPAHAGARHRAKRQATAAACSAQARPIAVVVATEAPIVPASGEATAVQAGADPYGFTAWLNGVRAGYGLAAVAFDPNLAGWAQVNNQHQDAYGLGHHVMGSARRQNSGMGAMSTVCAMWMSSGAHMDALLDPTIRVIGIATTGRYWTFNAY